MLEAAVKASQHGSSPAELILVIDTNSKFVFRQKIGFVLRTALQVDVLAFVNKLCRIFQLGVLNVRSVSECEHYTRHPKQLLRWCLLGNGICRVM